MASEAAILFNIDETNEYDIQVKDTAGVPIDITSFTFEGELATDWVDNGGTLQAEFQFEASPAGSFANGWIRAAVPFSMSSFNPYPSLRGKYQVRAFTDSPTNSRKKLIVFGDVSYNPSTKG